MNKQDIKGALTEYARRTAFNTRDLWPQIEGRAALSSIATDNPKHVGKSPRFRTSLLRSVVTAGVITLALLIAIFWLIQPPKRRPLLSSVTDILTSAANADKNPDVHSFHIRSVDQYEYTSSIGKDEGVATSNNESWVISPYTYREESTLTTPGGEEFVSMSVCDGNLLSRYQSQEPGIVLISEPLTRTRDMTYVSRFQQIIEGVGTGKYGVQNVGSEQVAGREAYVLEVTDLKPDGATNKYKVLHEKFWIDRDTFMVLKDEARNQQGNPRWTYQVTTLELNIDIPRSKFAFTKAAGATVWDIRPVEEHEASGLWQQAALQSGLPLYLPPATLDTSQSNVALKLVAGRPYFDALSRNVRIPYINPSSSIAERLVFRLPGITIEQGTPENISIDGDGYDVQVGERTGRFYPGTAGDVLVVDREGVRIEIRITAYNSHLLAKLKAIEVAEALTPLQP